MDFDKIPETEFKGIGGYSKPVIKTDYTQELNVLYSAITEKELLKLTNFLIADHREPSVDLIKEKFEIIFKNCKNNLDNLEIMFIALINDIHSKRSATGWSN